MKHALLLVAVVAALAVSGPAYSQYMYLDVDGNGICDANDVLTGATTSVDVWLDTDSNKDGSPASCNTADGDLTMNSYEFFLHATGAVTYGSWSDNQGFGTSFGDLSAGSDAYYGRGGSEVKAPGLYLLGTLSISGVGANTTLSIIDASTVNPTGLTSFGSQCSGNAFINTYTLNDDWFDVCGTAVTTPVTETTWGAIKKAYK